MKVPVSIPLGGRKIRVIYKLSLKDDDGSRLLGYTERGKGEIHIAKDHDDGPSLWHTIYHELTHVVFDITGHSRTMTESQEESLVVALESMLGPLLIFGPNSGVRYREIEFPFEETDEK